MDISGYARGGRTGRSAHLMQSTWAYHSDPAGKRKRRKGLSMGAKAVLLLLFLGAAWAGIRHALHQQPGAATNGSGGSSTGGAATGTAGGGTAKAAGGTAAKSSAKGAGQKPAAKAPVDPALAAKLDAALEARIERMMRINPTYRGPGKVDAFPQMADASRVLLASAGRLAWYRYDTDELRVIHEGAGAYYGAFTGGERDVLGGPATLWVVSRPAAAGSHDELLQLSLDSGRELRRAQLDSAFTHDAVRRRDRVWVASTGDGRVLELSYPSMDPVQAHALFSAEQHVSTLGPDASGKLWAVLHNQGAPSSDIVQVDLGEAKELARISGVGDRAQGLVFWDRYILTLDSGGGALVRADPVNGETAKLWQAGDSPVLLRGLCVVDDIAFFGICPQVSPQQRADPSVSCELAAYDLKSSLLLWRRRLDTKGLLNIVAAPHLQVESTTYSANTRPLISYRDKPSYLAAFEAAQQWAAQQEKEAQGAQQQLVAQQQAAQQAQAVLFRRNGRVHVIGPLRTRREANLVADALTLKAALDADADRSKLRLRSRKGRLGVHLSAAAANELYRIRFANLVGELQAAAHAAARIIKACQSGWTKLRESCFEAECLLFHGALLTGSVATTAILLDLAPSLAAAAGSRSGAAGQPARYQVVADSSERLEGLLGLPPARGSIRAATGETALHWATAAGNTAVVQRYLAAAPHLSTVQCKAAGRTPMHLAAAMGDVPMLRLLLQAAPQAAAAADKAGQTPLAALVEDGQSEAVELLALAHPASVAASTIDSLPLLHWSVRNCDSKMAARLLAAAPQAAKLRAADGSTALHLAAALYAVEALQMLVSACPAAASIKDANGMLTIHAAVQCPVLAEAVDSLLAAAPATALAPYRGSLPLHLAAAMHGMTAVVAKLLKAAPTAATALDEQGSTALHHAVDAGDTASVEVLLAAAPAAVNVFNSAQRTPLTMCMQYRRADHLRVLLQVRPSAESVHAALRLAILNRYVEALECLVAAMPSAASTLVYPYSRQTFLHYAAQFEDGSVLRTLAQADPAAAVLHDDYRRTPIQLAYTAPSLRGLMPFTPVDMVLRRLGAFEYYALPYSTRLDLICECVATKLPLSPADWALVPSNCTGLGRALPSALAHSDEQARSLVAHLPAADRSRLQLFALCLHRAQHRLHIHVPSELVRLLLSLFAA
ncbi:serine threonine- phosphatase 6 regulatory ankyrin repeat subunit B-like [Chlorella sorokiniana]|uniref:Serine threonine-phosphatase 6 regulatory ankyrin repeat subunit B-like n=1 Tax=Chlorella sorokiniana TaxID=3076 RepID=A0A2P6U1D0_CHLSO|nr:serine threonine- phosphatase 6 regulatory ankyrin repeat subunit B-like [Chlorella sorokiniana]|eukprot:PRW60120.1 serine threonine- phosphatase 6 regulatory ankyrin repeat subunit B-like [Chlorella sorokiniana]